MSGFRKVMRMSEDKARQIYNEKLSERENHVQKLREKYGKSKGLAFGNGKLDALFEKNSKKAENLLLFLENSEKQAMMNPTLAQNAIQEQTIRSLSESRISEAMQTGGAMQLMLPTDIVKISRIGYSNAVAQDIFDVWGMQSMKDSLYKLETTYGSDDRGVPEGGVTYETYLNNGGRYPSTIETQVITATSGTASDTLDNAPVIPFKVAIYDEAGNQIAVDNGSGKLVGSLGAGDSTIDYTSGAISIKTVGATDKVTVQYAYDFENEDLFEKTGSVLLNLVEYQYSAILYPLAVEWTRFSEDLMTSKLGLSAKDMLIAGAGDEFRKATDERAIAKGIKASSWTSGINFDTDFSTAGSDSSFEHAQSVLTAIVNGENLTYDQLGRLPDTTNIVCDSKSYAYLTKHRQWSGVKPTSKVGIFKVGELDGRGVYMAPANTIKNTSGKGTLYLFGKSTQAQNVDAPVSIGTYGTGITTNPVELKNFNSQMGLGIYADSRINNKYFATKVNLLNLSANS